MGTAVNRTVMRGNRVRRRHARHTLTLALLTFATGGHAMNYWAKGDIRVDGLYNNNIRLQAKDAIAVYGMDVKPTLSLNAGDETTDVSLNGVLSFKRYDETDFNTNNQNVNLSIKKQLEHNELRLNINGTRDNTLNSELLDSGRINASRHTQYVAAPSWTYIVGDRDMLTLEGSYTQSRYQDQVYTDYTFWRSALRWTHILNERLRVSLEANHSDYQSRPIDVPAPGDITYRILELINGVSSDQLYKYESSSVDNGFSLGGEYSFSEQITLSLMVGRAWNKISYDQKGGSCNNPNFNWAPFGTDMHALYCSQRPSTTDTSTTVNGSFNWANELHRLSLTASQQTQPSSDGYTLQSTTLAANWNYQAWEKGSLSLDLIAGRNRAQGGGDNEFVAIRSNRKFSFATLGYHYKITEDWTANCSYQYYFQDFEKRDSVANSQAVFLGIRYKTRDWHWNR